MRIAITLVMLVLCACGKSPSQSASSEVARKVLYSGSFAGVQYIEAPEVGKVAQACVAGSDGSWDCGHPMSMCWQNTSIAMMGDFTVSGDNTSVDRSGVGEPSVYNNGQFVLTNSGYTFDMAWFGSSMADGVVVTVFNSDLSQSCSELYFVNEGGN